VEGRVRYGVIGSGAMGGAYAAVLTNGMTGRGELVCVAGGRRAGELAARHGVEAAASPEELLARADVDAVLVATPHSTHLPLTVAAAKAGKHVLVEKPMGRTVAECDAMIAGAARTGVVLTVNKLTRYRDTPRAAKRCIDEGAIGEVRMIRVQLMRVGLEEHTPGKALGAMEWISDPAEGTSYLDWGSHACDMIRWLSGSDAVLAFGQFADFAAEPTPPLGRSGMTQYTMASGALAQVWMTGEMPPPGLSTETEYLVVGSGGILVCDMYGKLLLGRGGEWQVVVEQAPIDYVHDQWSPVRLAGWARQVQELTDALLGEGRPGVSAADGRAAIEMVEAAERSAATGAAVALPLD
jgi:predicted dehydrogenase